MVAMTGERKRALGAASGEISIEGLDPRNGTGPDEIEEKRDAASDATTTTTNEKTEASPPAPPPPSASPTPASPSSPVPDGGWQAWMQVLGSFVVMMGTWGLVNSFGVFQTYYETELLPGSSSSAISWIGSLQGALMLMLGVVSGPLFDAGYFRGLMFAGTFLVVLGQFMASLCTAYWQVLLAQGLCVGVGCGLLFLPSAAILSQYFSRRRAIVLGIQSVGSPLAGVVFPLVFSRLQPALGFGWATRIIAFILLGLSAIPLVFLRPRMSPPPRRGTGTGRQHRAFVDPTALREPAYLLFCAGGLLAFLGLYVPYFYIQLFAIRRGLLAGQREDGFRSAYLVTLLNAGSVPGRLLPSLLADHLAGSSVAVLAATALGAAALAFAWLGVRGFGGAVAFALLFGFFNGGVTSLPPSAIAAITPDLSRLGTRMGMTFFFAGVAVLVGTPVAGAVLGDPADDDDDDDDDAAWTRLIAYSGATLLAGSAFYAASHVMHVRRARKVAGKR